MTDNEIINELKDKQYINWKYVSNEIIGLKIQIIIHNINKQLLLGQLEM